MIFELSAFNSNSKHKTFFPCFVVFFFQSYKGYKFYSLYQAKQSNA